jgi:diguanylate cyclase (GGDEF)-like protein
VILCDIDHFKQVNDTHGHAAGDAVLLRFAGLLHAVARPGVDSVVRYGGEEFLLVLPGTGLEDSVHLSEWLRAHFKGERIHLGPGGPALRATASFGVAATADATATPLAALIETADKRMVLAKRNGRDRVEACPVPSAPFANAA